MVEVYMTYAFPLIRNFLVLLLGKFGKIGHIWKNLAERGAEIKEEDERKILCVKA